MSSADARDLGADWSLPDRLAGRWPRLMEETREHPFWIGLFVLGRVPAMRRAVGTIAAWRRPSGPLSCLAAPSALAHPPPVPRAVEVLRRDGILPGLRLDPARVAAIRAFAEAAECHGGPGGRLRFPAHRQEEAARRTGRALPVGNLVEVQRDCPDAAAVARDPWLRMVAAAYLGAAPVLIDLRLWWSFPAPGASRAERSAVAQDAFHFDLGDWRQLKLFVYLTDVGPAEGPHAYVRGSHARRPLLWQLHPFSTRSAERLAARYGAAAFATLTGTAGTAFLEDPFGFHTGLGVRRGRRLMLEVSFGITRTTRRATLVPDPG